MRNRTQLKRKSPAPSPHLPMVRRRGNGRCQPSSRAARSQALNLTFRPTLRLSLPAMYFVEISLVTFWSWQRDGRQTVRACSSWPKCRKAHKSTERSLRSHWKMGSLSTPTAAASSWKMERKNTLRLHRVSNGPGEKPSTIIAKWVPLHRSSLTVHAPA